MADKPTNPQNPEEENSVDIQSNDQEFVHSVEEGVMSDDLNYKKLLFWSGVGIVVLVIFFVSLIQFFGYTEFLSTEEASTGQTTLINQLRQNDKKVLNSFGVVDEQQGLYRIPIDSAINLVAVDTKK